MTKYNEAGKGSGRRQEDVKKIHNNWDLIFGAKKKEQTMNANYESYEDEPQDLSEDIERSEYHEGDWTCEMCGGPMYRQAHWSYGQCDDCGARQELESDY